MRRLILLLPLAFAGCATTGSGGSDLLIETASKGQAVPGAHCVVSTYSGSWNVVSPGTVNAGGVNGDLRIVCDKAGYRTSETVFRPSAGTGSNVGLGIGGGSGRHVGVGVGLSVPIGIGRSGYPSQITVEMTPQ